jgi:hypothetical protein
MRELDAVVGAPFALASAVRRARVFHPRGVLAQGHAELGAHWWPVQGRIPVTARLSRGIGLPGLLPDVQGLAVRLHLISGPWDLLLVSAQLPTRVVMWPARGWSSARYSSLTAYCAEDGPPTWVFALPDPGQPRRGSTAALVDGGPLHFTLSLATARGDATAAGWISLGSPTAVADDEQPVFDPVINLPPELRMWPHWLAGPRRAAYGASRGGRGAALPEAESEPHL